MDLLISVSVMGYINKIKKNDEKKISSPVIQGIYLGEYDFPERWINWEWFDTIKGYHTVESEEGIFLIDYHDFIREDIIIKKGIVLFLKQRVSK